MTLGHFEVEIPEWDVLNTDPTEHDALIYFTDASRRNGLGGMGIYGPFLRHFKVLGASPTSHKAKMYALNVCSRICLNL
jgi:hypothetical protein